MLNPDGVRHGNYRCSNLGVDLNRRWSNPNRIFHPIIYSCKQLLISLPNVIMFCDIHGHSKKQGVFMYGCPSNNKKLSTKIIPGLISGLNVAFDYSLCHNRLEKAKESTARISIYRALGLAHSFTL